MRLTSVNESAGEMDAQDRKRHDLPAAEPTDADRSRRTSAADEATPAPSDPDALVSDAVAWCLEQRWARALTKKLHSRRDALRKRTRTRARHDEARLASQARVTAAVNQSDTANATVAAMESTASVVSTVVPMDVQS